MAEQKTLEQRVNEDLMSDNSPLSPKEYLEFVKTNFPYYTYNPFEEDLDKKSRYYSGGKEITSGEYDKIIEKGERHFCLQLDRSGNYKLHTNNAQSNLRYRKTPQLEKFRDYLGVNYQKLFKTFFELSEQDSKSIINVFDLINNGKDTSDLPKFYTPEYTIKLCLILNDYNQKVSEEDKVVGIEG